mmetsp:Transcript_132042/g.228869  ORF Transcript_132042/g.228869 Transcript_132042/m.228869 type:complete len:322 (+) Transcript_132042:517-1482(+)
MRGDDRVEPLHQRVHLHVTLVQPALQHQVHVRQAVGEGDGYLLPVGDQLHFSAITQDSGEVGLEVVAKHLLRHPLPVQGRKEVHGLQEGPVNGLQIGPVQAVPDDGLPHDRGEVQWQGLAAPHTPAHQLAQERVHAEVQRPVGPGVRNVLVAVVARVVPLVRRGQEQGRRRGHELSAHVGQGLPVGPPDVVGPLPGEHHGPQPLGVPEEGRRLGGQQGVDLPEERVLGRRVPLRLQPVAGGLAAVDGDLHVLTGAVAEGQVGPQDVLHDGGEQQGLDPVQHPHQRPLLRILQDVDEAVHHAEHGVELPQLDEPPRNLLEGD